MRIEPGPPPEWRSVPGSDPASPFPALAAGQVITRWTEAAAAVPPASDTRVAPLMVGLGVPEIAALNQAGRRHLLAAGHIGGPSISAWGRCFQEGDRLVAFGRGAHCIRPGMSGTIVSVDPRRRVVAVDWPVGRLDMSRQMLERVGHGYAVTPRLAARMDCPVFLLGSAEGVGLDRARIVAQVSVERRGPALERGRVAEPNPRAIVTAL